MPLPVEGLLCHTDRDGNQIPLPPDEWEAVPAFARLLILHLLQENRQLRARVKELEAQVQHLQERLGLNSRNSSKPPSTDPPGTPRKKKRATGRPPGGQKGHPGARRELLPEDKVTRVVDHHPEACGQCGKHGASLAELHGKSPVRHQVVDIPPIVVEVTEHRRHWAWCPDCGHHTLAKLPDGISWGMLGPRLLAVDALLTGRFRMSRRDVQMFLELVLGIRVSLGAVAAHEALVSTALASPVDEAAQAIPSAPVVNADESGWKLSDKRGWIWCANTPDLAVYRITPRRNRQAAKDLLGEDFDGILGTDRYSGYSHHPPAKRAICWGHLERDFERIAGRGGVSRPIGEEGVLIHNQVFEHWHRFKEGRITRVDLKMCLEPVKQRMQALLERGAACGHSKTENTCANLLKIFPALWTFASVEGVEPTNNSSERALRPAVRWRKVSFGSRSETGKEFAERMLTVVETCRRQARNVVDYLTEAVSAFIHGQAPPSLLPRPET